MRPCGAASAGREAAPSDASSTCEAEPEDDDGGDGLAGIAVITRGGNGGGGMGGPSIGIAYMDEDRVILEDVTFAIGAPGTGGATYTGDSEAADDGFAAEKYRFTP
ncbi:hypothetical protein ACSRUE_36615 [Sorangium sp. KYC3313]|uniref:hypothetical protein n=1 Tax=Sorangium sp. KYC3313 TaxID=3449740 RepID=UPI003F8A53ED